MDQALDGWSAPRRDGPDPFPPAVRAAYHAALANPASLHAICEEYRAAATLDLEHDEADQRAGRRIGCPLLALWSRTGAVAEWYDPLAIWRTWADDVRGHAMDGGHFLPEESPVAVADELLRFLRE